MPDTTPTPAQRRIRNPLDRLADLTRENARLRRIEQAARECVRAAEKWHGVSESGYLRNVEQHVAERQIAYDALKAALAEGSGE